VSIWINFTLDETTNKKFWFFRFADGDDSDTERDEGIEAPGEEAEVVKSTEKPMVNDLTLAFFFKSNKEINFFRKVDDVQKRMLAMAGQVMSQIKR